LQLTLKGQELKSYGLVSLFLFLVRYFVGTVNIHPNAKTSAHHHGSLESIIYIVKGRARMKWGERLEFTAEAGPGDFIFVPPYVPHQEINALPDEELECVLVRSDNEAIVVNLDIDGEENPENVYWVDPIHTIPYHLDQHDHQPDLHHAHDQLHEGNSII